MSKANDRLKKWRENLPQEKKEKIRKENAERAKASYRSDPKVRERQQANFKNSYDSDPEFRSKIVFSASVGRYGWVPAQYEAKLKEQDHHCALCPSENGDAGRRLHIDHNHACCETGPPKGRTCGECNRGLLCGPCNRRLATVEDVLTMGTVVPKKGTWLDRALRYLQRYAPVTTHKDSTQGNA